MSRCKKERGKEERTGKGKREGEEKESDRLTDMTDRHRNRHTERQRRK